MVTKEFRFLYGEISKMLKDLEEHERTLEDFQCRFWGKDQRLYTDTEVCLDRIASFMQFIGDLKEDIEAKCDFPEKEETTSSPS